MVDMNKAYDRVDWNFLHAVLLTMNFSPSLINLIQECVTTINCTLLINGSTPQYFKHSRGLRQGDPLSPYIFLMCANILSVALMQAEVQKSIKGIKLGNQGCALSLIYFC